MHSTAKRWCFTINNYEDEDEVTLRYRLPDRPEFVYLIYGHEEAPQTGTPHLQGFVTFDRRVSGKQLKRYLECNSAHIEVAKGSVSDNIRYCSKGVNIIEVGEPPLEQWEKGADATKKKWEQAKVASHAGLFEEIPTDLWIKYRNSWIMEYNDYHLKIGAGPLAGDIKQHFLWIYGPTGTGKSHAAREIAFQINRSQEPYLKLVNKWWHGFHGQQVTIIEEVQPDMPNPLKGMFKQWLDKWAFAAETKGGMISNLRPQYIIITSNYSVDDVFGDDAEALKRRLYIWHKVVKSSVIQWPDIASETVDDIEDSDEELIALARQGALADARPPDAQGNTSTPSPAGPLCSEVPAGPLCSEVPASPEY